MLLLLLPGRLDGDAAAGGRGLDRLLEPDQGGLVLVRRRVVGIGCRDNGRVGVRRGIASNGRHLMIGDPAGEARGDDRPHLETKDTQHIAVLPSVFTHRNRGG